MTDKAINAAWIALASAPKPVDLETGYNAMRAAIAAYEQAKAGGAKYALIVVSNCVRSGSDDIITKEGDEFWVVFDDGYVSSSPASLNGPSRVPANVKVFDTEDDALAFGQTWRGHPWWCDPIGPRSRAVAVRPRMVQKGWERIA